MILRDHSFQIVHRISKLEIHTLLNYQEDKKEIYILSMITPVTNSITRNEIIIVRTFVEERKLEKDNEKSFFFFMLERHQMHRIYIGSNQ